MGPWSNKGLQVLLIPLVVVAAVVATALSTHGTFGKKPAAKSAPDAPATGARASQVTPSGQPSGGSRPSAPSTPSQSAPAPTDQPRDAVGRPNPFTPLITRQRSFYAPQLGAPPRQPSRPGSPNAPAFGIDLPVPPGFTVPGAQAAPPPGAGMTVGAIIGGSERVAIIQAQGTLFIVGVGDPVGDAVVVDILEDKVVMRRSGVTFELRFGGEGS